MKSFQFLVLFIFFGFQIHAQDIIGQWHGLLKMQGLQLRLVFNVSNNGSELVSTMDSPEQGAKDIPVEKTNFENGKIKWELPKFNIVYNGELKDGEIIGTFSQAGNTVPLTLTRNEIEPPRKKRKQEPEEPYPYHVEQVSFKNNEANITLAGTLTLPSKNGTYPVVVLISGSGPQDRNEEILNHRPFLIIADYFTRKGIGVLRYDDRGVGKSTGNFQLATSMDFASDVMSAVAYLKTRNDVNHTQIGLVGHSEGGLIAPIVANKTKDVSYIVLLAAPGIRGDKLLLSQSELIARNSGMSEKDIKEANKSNSKIFKTIIKSKDDKKLVQDLDKLLEEAVKKQGDLVKGMSKADFKTKQIGELTSPWLRFYIKYDPKESLSKVKIPVLALNGEKDLQVPASVNLEAIRKIITKNGNKDITTKSYPKLNHMFQQCVTGSPNEYGKIEQTFSPDVLQDMADWILKLVKSN